MSQKVAPHIQYLLEVEKSTRCKYGGHIRFYRISESVISVSCEGYNHQDLMDVEAKLLKLGLKYDFSRGLQEFDRMCGRTFTYFKEPKV